MSGDFSENHLHDKDLTPFAPQTFSVTAGSNREEDIMGVFFGSRAVKIEATPVWSPQFIFHICASICCVLIVTHLSRTSCFQPWERRCHAASVYPSAYTDLRPVSFPERIIIVFWASPEEPGTFACLSLPFSLLLTPDMYGFQSPPSLSYPAHFICSSGFSHSSSKFHFHQSAKKWVLIARPWRSKQMGLGGCVGGWGLVALSRNMQSNHTCVLMDGPGVYQDPPP